MFLLHNLINIESVELYSTFWHQLPITARKSCMACCDWIRLLYIHEYSHWCGVYANLARFVIFQRRYGIPTNFQLEFFIFFSAWLQQKKIRLRARKKYENETKPKYRVIKIRKNSMLLSLRLATMWHEYFHAFYNEYFFK